MSGRALVLAGGGARGAFQIGMIEELVCGRGLDFDIIRGVGAGAINAAFLAQAARSDDPAQSLDNLKRQALALRELWTVRIQGNESIYRKRSLGRISALSGADTLFDVGPVRELIEQSISVDRLRDHGRDLAFGAVSLLTGRYVPVTPASEQFIEHLLASVSLPPVFPFRQVAGDVLIDGSMRDVTPLASAFRAGATEIYVLLNSATERGADDGLPACGVEPTQERQWQDNWLGLAVSSQDVLQRGVAILTDAIYREDIRRAHETNTAAHALEAVDRVIEQLRHSQPDAAGALDGAVAGLRALGRRHVPLFVIAPRRRFNPAEEPGRQDLCTEFDPGLIRAAIEEGRAAARDPASYVWTTEPAVAAENYAKTARRAA